MADVARSLGTVSLSGVSSNIEAAAQCTAIALFVAEVTGTHSLDEAAAAAAPLPAPVIDLAVLQAKIAFSRTAKALKRLRNARG